MSSDSSKDGQQDIIQKMTALRQVVGTEPKEYDLINLLQRCRGDVALAVDTFFEGGGVHATPSNSPASAQQPTTGVPVARPTEQQQQPALVQVACPDGMRAGEQINVTTPTGVVRVTIPEGIEPGKQFLVRAPSEPPPPTAYAQPVNAHASYPGQAQLPQHQHQRAQSSAAYPQQQPQVIHVVGSPYYGGYGYGYGYDPFLGMGMGMLGGMMIADAMWW